MARLLPGENAKIDNINSIVLDVKNGNMDRMEELLKLFHPLLLGICKRWSIYFGDESHALIPFDSIISDAQYWFMHYTIEKYTVDGSATYNKFIKDHMLQRIRYIYECELKYRKRHIFPDPDKNSMIPECDKHDMLDDVILKYSSHNMGDTMEDDLINEQETRTKNLLAAAILIMMDDRRYFTEREKTIFVECEVNSITHEAMGKKLGISRTRVSQIMARTREKLMVHMNTNKGIRRLLVKWRA